MHFYRKCWFDLFKEQFNISLLNFGQNYFVQLRWNWFSVRLPSSNACNYLLFVVYSIFKLCWSSGCVSLLTLSFSNVCAEYIACFTFLVESLYTIVKWCWGSVNELNWIFDCNEEYHWATCMPLIATEPRDIIWSLQL